MILYPILPYRITIGPSSKCARGSVSPESSAGLKTPKMFAFLIHSTYQLKECIPIQGIYVPTTYLQSTAWDPCPGAMFYVFPLQTYHHGRQLLGGMVATGWSPVVLLCYTKVPIQSSEQLTTPRGAA